LSQFIEWSLVFHVGSGVLPERGKKERKKLEEKKMMA
jgi:hypothetical protein